VKELLLGLKKYMDLLGLTLLVQMVLLLKIFLL
jgi:hypothetical protein